MNPLDGQRQFEVRAEQVVWHLVSAGVLGLLLLLLVVSVTLLDEAPQSETSPETKPRIARPIEGEATAQSTVETSSRHQPRPPASAPIQDELPLDRGRGRPWGGPLMGGGAVGA